MKDTFTLDEILEILKTALEKSHMDAETESSVSNMMNEAWNRGANCMYNYVLIGAYTFDKREASA